MATVFLQPRSPISGLVNVADNKTPNLTFMYTPQIEYSHDVKYDAYTLTHTNYQPYAFSRSENPTISLSCKFTAQTTNHFLHSEFALRFLRTYTKMNYGRNDPQRGQPPRILRFYAYGDGIFHDVPVVISKFGMTFPEDVDYVTYNIQVPGKPPFDEDTGYTGKDDGSPNATLVSNEKWKGPPGGFKYPNAGTPSPSANSMSLPMVFTVNISLLVQQNLSRTVNEFTLESFAKGELSKKGYI